MTKGGSNFTTREERRMYYESLYNKNTWHGGWIDSGVYTRQHDPDRITLIPERTQKE